VCKISTVGNDMDGFLLDFCKRLDIIVASAA
jgi:hypothetical protein